VYHASSQWALTCVIAFAGALVVPAHAAPLLEQFFRPALPSGEDLPTDRIYPEGRLFPFSLYSVGGGGPNKSGDLLPGDQVQAALSRVRAAGFTMIGPQYELNGRVLTDAARHGLQAIYRVGLPKDQLNLPQAQIEKAIRDQVLAVVDDPNLAWWYVTPEELRSWRQEEIGFLDIACRTIAQNDPLKRPVWMYDPGHRHAQGLVPTARHLSVLGKGMYTNYSKRRDARVWVRWTIDQELQAIAQAGSKAIPIAVPEMFQQPQPQYLHLIPAWVRHDVYAALIAGAQGVVVFSMRVRPTFEAHEAYLQAYEQVAREVCVDPGLGQVLLFGQRRQDLKIEVLDGPPLLNLEYRGNHAQYPAIAHLDIAYGTHRYLLAVNSSNDVVRVVCSGLPNEKLVAVDLFGQQSPPVESEDGALKLCFAALEVKAFRLIAAAQ